MNKIQKKYFPLFLTIILDILRCTTKDDLLLLLKKRKRANVLNVPYIRPRVISDNVFLIMSGSNLKTKEHLRISSDTFRKIVSYLPDKSWGWCKEYELICFLYWMACGCSYRVVAGFIGWSRYTVCRIIHKMLDKFIEMRHIINHGTPDEYENIGLKFCRKTRSAAFSKFIGAIDGTHIRIKCPINKHDEYINHKKFYSIQVQAVFDSNMKFTDVFVGFPGSVHDTRVFQNSPLYTKGTYPPEGYYLFGDKGYPCQISPVAVITPYKDNVTPDQKRFNEAHSKGRIIIECAFGVLKNRWRNIFNRDLELSLKNCI